MSYLNRLGKFTLRSVRYEIEEEEVNEVEQLIDDGQFNQLIRKTFEGVQVAKRERNQEVLEAMDFRATELIGMCLAVNNTETQIRRVFNAIQSLDERFRQKREMLGRREVTTKQVQAGLEQLVQEAKKGVSPDVLLKKVGVNLLRWQTPQQVSEEIENSLLSIRSVAVYSSAKLADIAEPLLLHGIDAVFNAHEQMHLVFPDFVEFISQVYAYFSSSVSRRSGRRS